MKSLRYDKPIKLDVQARDEQGRWYDVEMQCENQPAFVDRILYYWARTFGWQLEEGQGYQELHPVLSIIFMDFSLLKEEPRYHTLLDVERGCVWGLSIGAGPDSPD